MSMLGRGPWNPDFMMAPDGSIVGFDPRQGAKWRAEFFRTNSDFHQIMYGQVDMDVSRALSLLLESNERQTKMVEITDAGVARIWRKTA